MTWRRPGKLAEEAEGDERELLRNEMADLEADIERLEGELRALLLPATPTTAAR
ncbi:MAG: hypothetical protein Ct9H300mP31_12910 [Acidimicrobiaceae bacterium]|nr:MAG: hypothetical protein Ct9H300mP31_12910 [Acidimicrobiaceae bacterium]